MNEQIIRELFKKSIRENPTLPIPFAILHVIDKLAEELSTKHQAAFQVSDYLRKLILEDISNFNSHIKP